MTIEFVDPDEALAPARPRVDETPVARPSALAGRLLGTATVLAAALAGVAALVPLYTVVRTAFVIDFDGTSTQNARIPFDAFGHSDPVPLVTGGGGPALAGGGFTPASSTLSVSLGEGVSYGPWWLGLTAVLVVVALWSLVRPRSTRPAAFVALVGGLLLGSVGAAWLSIRTTSNDSIALIRFSAEPGPGLWLVTAAGGLALVAGLLAATRPPLRRLLPRRRRPI